MTHAMLFASNAAATPRVSIPQKLTINNRGISTVTETAPKNIAILRLAAFWLLGHQLPESFSRYVAEAWHVYMMAMKSLCG
jgi:hypothetical protein